VSVLVWNKEQPRAQALGKIQHGVFALLVVVIFLLRFTGESFNTVFYDEAVNATLGQEIWAGDFSQNATSWTFGSYMYPFLAGAVNQLAGETGLRLLSATLSTLSAVLVFFITHRLFTINAALWAMALFGLSGGSISLGQLAVYDTLGLPLMAGALLSIVQSAFANGRGRGRWLVVAGMLFSLSVLAKYIGILFLPALLLAAVMLYLAREDVPSILPLFTVFLLVVVSILGLYFALNFDALLSLLTERNTLLYVASDRRSIVDTFIIEAGIILPLALLGMLFLRSAPFYRHGRRSTDQVKLLTVLLPVFFVTTFAPQLYQVYSENIQSLWKHTVYTAAFLTPLAGFALIRLTQKSQERDQHGTRIYRVAVALAIFAMLAWFIEYGLGRNWGFQNSWPNARNVVNYLRAQDISLDTRILAEQSAVYEYYFDFGPNDRDVWSNTFYMEYRGLQGEEAMIGGIQDHFFDYVILDDYYTPDTNRKLEAALRAAGYSVSYQEPEPQELSTDQVISARVFTLE
jgi:4-amino-4-deoxy-L-arabinose transferase-like glycosyltransferase